MSFAPDYHLQEAIRELAELVQTLHGYRVSNLSPQLTELLQGQVDEAKERAATLLFEIGPQQDEVVETGAQ
jgi:stage III sporulation protein SpoIIIAA